MKHIVLLNFKKTLSPDYIQSIFNALEDLRKIIPEILYFSSGAYDSNENLNKGFTHAFVMKFNTSTDRDNYLSHPEHKRIANEMIIPALEDGLNSVIAFDYTE